MAEGDAFAARVGAALRRCGWAAAIMAWLAWTGPSAALPPEGSAKTDNADNTRKSRAEALARIARRRLPRSACIASGRLTRHRRFTK